MTKKKMAKKIRRLEESMESVVPVLSILMDHIDMDRHETVMTREELLKRGGIDGIMAEKAPMLERIRKIMDQENVNRKEAAFLYKYEKQQEKIRADIKELETMWTCQSFQ